MVCCASFFFLSPGEENMELIPLLKALFSSSQKPKSFQDFLSHRIFRHMHETLNIDENKN